MFQYALGRRLSLNFNDELKFDVSWFGNIQKGETPRELEVDKFNIDLKKAAETEIALAKGGFIRRMLVKIIYKIRGRLNRTYFYQFHPALLKKRKHIYLEGYFQSYKYFEFARETILKDFVLKKGYSAEALEISKDIKQTEQSVALHVRRGDFAASCIDWNGLCNVAYYEKAIAEIQKKHSNIKLFIFSDDIEWARENLKFKQPMVFVSRPAFSAAEELLLMSLCKHQITANSTFSWWGAWLNQNPEKIVVTPSVWLVAANIKTDDLLPPDWIKL